MLRTPPCCIYHKNRRFARITENAAGSVSDPAAHCG